MKGSNLLIEKINMYGIYFLFNKKSFVFKSSNQFANSLKKIIELNTKKISKMKNRRGEGWLSKMDKVFIKTKKAIKNRAEMEKFTSTFFSNHKWRGR